MTPERPTSSELSEAGPELENAYQLVAAEDYAAALEVCQDLIKLAPRSAEIHNLHGLVLEALGQSDEALEAYRQSLRLDPDFDEAMRNMRELAAELAGGDDLVAVTRFLNLLEAQAAQYTLRQHGIWSYLSGGSLQIDGVRLYAGKNDLEQIVEILELESGELLDHWRCPKCESWEVHVPLIGRTRTCERCGHQWKV